MAGNLTALLPLEGLSFLGRQNISYVKLLAALGAVPAVAIILNVLSQLVRALPLDVIYPTYRFIVSATRQDPPSSCFPLGAHYRLRC